MPLSLAHRIISRFHQACRRHLEWIFRVTTTRPRQVMSVFFCPWSFLACPSPPSVLKPISSAFFPLISRPCGFFWIHWNGPAAPGEAYFLLEGDTQVLPVEAGRLAERLRLARVDGQPAFRRITWRLFDQEQAGAFTALMAYAVTHPQVFVAPEDARRYQNRFEPSQIDESLQRLQAELAGQFGGAMTSLATADPLFLRDLILPRLKAGSQATGPGPRLTLFSSPATAGC